LLDLALEQPGQAKAGQHHRARHHDQRDFRKAAAPRIALLGGA
jgi:hypothetical protein